jgi:hypothetical protein
MSSLRPALGQNCIIDAGANDLNAGIRPGEPNRNEDSGVAVAGNDLDQERYPRGVIDAGGIVRSRT